jgi:uncharacterized protein (DUF1330 family)
MSVYLVGDVEVLNSAAYREYGERFDPILEKYGGKILVVGGDPTPVEGDWRPHRLVILEFPDREAADAWYRSQEYAEIAPIRQEHARTHFITRFDGWETT